MWENRRGTSAGISRRHLSLCDPAQSGWCARHANTMPNFHLLSSPSSPSTPSAAENKESNATAPVRVLSLLDESDPIL